MPPSRLLFVLFPRGVLEPMRLLTELGFRKPTDVLSAFVLGNESTK